VTRSVATTEQVLRALDAVDDPDSGRAITELDMVKHVQVEHGTVELVVQPSAPGQATADRLSRDITAAVAALDGVSDVRVRLGPPAGAAAAGPRQRPTHGPAAGPGGQPVIPFSQLESDTRVLAIASGKGGVGKSSITVNLAVALARQGHQVGILDADIWGYSIPRMMGASGRPVAQDNMVVPLQAHGCKLISIGFFVDTERPVIWRGPMLHRALQQFLADVHWGELDFLLCDLPPGTGDIAISLAQMLPNADMLLVTTPQEAAQRVALRAGQATLQTGMRVGGVIENMATFIAPDTGKEYRIFGEGGGQLLAAELKTSLLGSIPIDPRLRAGADAGIPLVVTEPDAPASRVITAIAATLARSKPSLVGKSLPLQV
jgi:ATP-binding protein involved in chromosome partitioning